MAAIAALSETGNARIAMGGNMSAFDMIVAEIDDLYAEVDNWADGTDIETDEQDEALDVLDKRLLKAGQAADELREAEKKPLDDAVKAIQAKYHPLIGDTKAGKGRVPLARAALAPIRTRYKTKKAAEKAAAAAKARADAEAERAKAEEAIRASAGNLAAREVAEELLATAKEADKFANRQEKRATTGLGLRTSYAVAVDNLNDAIKHYRSEDKREFETLVLTLAQRDAARGIRAIPGIAVTEIKKAL
jgi:hypothetical protein